MVIDMRANLDEVVDELVYHSYRFNRLNRPDIAPERWAAVFQNAEAMEKRLQKELEGK